MPSPLTRSRLIKEQADAIIQDRGLHSMLTRFGDAHYTGSYTLDLMLKKDLDISLVSPELSLKSFFELGHELAILLRPHSIHYRNTRIKPIAFRPPEALYWAIVFEDWNIDLWVVPESYYRESERYISDIKEALTQERRKCILNIKSLALQDGIYGKTFGSRELYQAVCFENINSYTCFQKWLLNRTSIEA